MLADHYSDARSPLPGSIDEAVEPIELDARHGAGERLDRFVARSLASYSRTRIQHWIALGAVRVDGRIASAKQRVGGRERVYVSPQPLEADSAFRAEPVALSVVHEDRDILVLDKPAGLVVHPAAGNWHGTMLNGLLHRWPALARLPRAGIVHRLDKDTSGLLVVARTDAARDSLVGQLSARTMSRQYLAVVHGAPPVLFDADAPIGRNRINRLRMCVDGAIAAKPARTRFRVLQRSIATLPADGERAARQVELALVGCRLDTGRTHQIRVHLSWKGFPIVGDALYGGLADRAYPRQMLHAWHLGLHHPRNAELCEWVAPLPADFAGALAASELPAPELTGPRRPWVAASP